MGVKITKKLSDGNHLKIIGECGKYVNIHTSTTDALLIPPHEYVSSDQRRRLNLSTGSDLPDVGTFLLIPVIALIVLATTFMLWQTFIERESQRENRIIHV